MAQPSYREVCDGTTGHAEAVQITFDPQIIAFRELLEVFFAIHDPTTLNRQGPDVGTQYRSAIFYHDLEQKATAEQVIGELKAARIWNQAPVTEVTPCTAFYRAEEYHREYYRCNPDEPYCQLVVAPKVAKLRKEFQAKLNRI
jgi:peptide-methionine (S)-S-oxide reductase